MRAILMFSLTVKDKVTRVSTDHNFLKKKESRNGVEPGDSGSVPVVNLVDRTGDSSNKDRVRERKALLDEDN